MRTTRFPSSDLERENMLVYATVTIALWTTLIITALSVQA
jgi:hypothetical protein